MFLCKTHKILDFWLRFKFVKIQWKTVALKCGQHSARTQKFEPSNLSKFQILFIFHCKNIFHLTLILNNLLHNVGLFACNWTPFLTNKTKKI